jgi:hypothetical protein
MQFIFMNIHVLYPFRRRKASQNSWYPPDHIGRKLPGIIFLKIPL